MSYIDSYKHEVIGLFAGLPVYHPLEDIPGSAEPDLEGDFACTTTQIVIGGGGGEWPGLVVKSPVHAVAAFIIQIVEVEDYPALDKIIDEIGFREQIFEFCGWQVEHYHHFHELCQSEAMVHPFGEDADLNLEAWLACSIGEFIFYAMPELAPPFTAEIRKPLNGVTHKGFNNVLLVPPNIPILGFCDNAWNSTRRN